MSYIYLNNDWYRNLISKLMVKKFSSYENPNIDVLKGSSFIGNKFIELLRF